jgi:Tol biopolymer transport system component
MNTTRNGTPSFGSRGRSVMMVLLALVPSACMGSPSDIPVDEVDPGASVIRGEDLPVIQIVEGTFDGTDLTFRTLQPDELIARGLMADPNAVAADGVGVSEEALVDIPSHACTPSTCTGADYVAFSNVSGGKRAITNGAAVSNTPAVPLWSGADAANCGAAPSTGVCQQVRMRNLYTTQLERVYADFLSITPTGTATTAAAVRASPYTAPTDFGLNPAVANGLFRAGEMGRSSPATGGVTMWWAFSGTATGTAMMTFSFLVQVRGLVVTPTVRANLAAGVLDAPASDYPTQTPVPPLAANIGISGDGRLVTFAGAGIVYLKNMSTGTLSTIASGCTSASNPHISSNGNVVVFQAAGCDLTGEGATTASPQIYAFDVSSSTTTLVSRSATGGYANGTSQLPRVNQDGTVVAFQSIATNLIAGMPVRANCPEIFRFDRIGSTMSHASAIRFSDILNPAAGWDAGCTASSVAGIAPDISGDGNLIVFSSARPLDATADTNGRGDIYAYDQAASDGSGAAIVYRVSMRSTGAQITTGLTTGATGAAISADGSTIAFETDATDVVSGQTTSSLRRHVYRRSSAEGDDATIVRVTRRVDDGEPTGSAAGFPALSGSGRFVAFWSAATDTASVAGVFTVAGSQLYVCDMEAPIMSLQRCWVASAMQPTASGGFSTLNGSASTGVRFGFAYPDELSAGYAAWQGAPTGGFGSMNNQGQQIFVSPVGDPRYQQPVITP